MYYKVAKVAADWWIEEMKKKCKRLFPDKLTENNSNLEIIEKSLARDFSRFHAILINEIVDSLLKSRYICLTCCYYPNRQLSKIAKKAQISTNYFPTHAEMHIENTSIRVLTTGNYFHELPLPK